VVTGHWSLGGQWSERDELSFAMKFIAIKRSTDAAPDHRSTADIFMHVYDVIRPDQFHR